MIIDIVTVYVNMCLFNNYIFLLFLITPHCFALTCRSEHGKKEEEIKRIFNKCRNQANNNNSTEESRIWSSNNRNQWEYENRNENKNNGYRNDGMGSGQRGHRGDNGAYERYNKMGTTNWGNENISDRVDDRWNSMNNRYDGSNMNGYGNGRNRNDMNNYGRNDQINGRDDFLHSEELNGDITSRNNYYTPPQPSRRYKREKRLEMNSGQRSQYNPHSQRSSNFDSNSNRNSSNNSSEESERACVLHCVFENLHVTDDNGMPDRYLMTHSFTKDSKSEDTRDFVQESIEECYQLADNENTEDKCEFSNNLMTCFVEKARANCDDFNGMNSYFLH